MNREKNDRAMSGMMKGLLFGLAAAGVLILARELPAMRRYLRIRRM